MDLIYILIMCLWAPGGAEMEGERQPRPAGRKQKWQMVTWVGGGRGNREKQPDLDMRGGVIVKRRHTWILTLTLLCDL